MVKFIIFFLFIRKDVFIINVLFNICIVIGMSKFFVWIYMIDNMMLNMVVLRKLICNNVNNIVIMMVVMFVFYFVVKCWSKNLWKINFLIIGVMNMILMIWDIYFLVLFIIGLCRVFIIKFGVIYVKLYIYKIRYL